MEGRSARQDSYPIYVTRSPEDTVERLLGLVGDAKVAVITDTTVAELHGPLVIGALKKAGIEPEVAAVPAGERHKTLRQAGELLDWHTGTQIGRRDLLVLLGGGVVIDMGGFVSSAYMRGIPYVNLPTTLIGQVDAGIGGCRSRMTGMRCVNRTTGTASRSAARGRGASRPPGRLRRPRPVAPASWPPGQSTASTSRRGFTMPDQAEHAAERHECRRDRRSPAWNASTDGDLRAAAPRRSTARRQRSRDDRARAAGVSASAIASRTAGQVRPPAELVASVDAERRRHERADRRDREQARRRARSRC